MKFKRLYETENNIVESQLTIPQQHQKKIALSTLKMSDVGANIAGGMTKEEARKFLKSIGYSDINIKKLEENINESTYTANDILYDKNKNSIYTKDGKYHTMVQSGKFSHFYTPDHKVVGDKKYDYIFIDKETFDTDKEYIIKRLNSVLAGLVENINESMKDFDFKNITIDQFINSKSRWYGAKSTMAGDGKILADILKELVEKFKKDGNSVIKNKDGEFSLVMTKDKKFLHFSIWKNDKQYYIAELVPTNDLVTAYKKIYENINESTSYTVNDIIFDKTKKIAYTKDEKYHTKTYTNTKNVQHWYDKNDKLLGNKDKNFILFPIDINDYHKNLYSGQLNAVLGFKQPKEEDKLKDLGYKNSWKQIPDIVKNCKHSCTKKQIGRQETQVTCDKCGFTYKIDSSD